MKTSRYAVLPSRVLAIALALMLAFPLLWQGTAEAKAEEGEPSETVQISEGEVVWGFKESWRNYISKDGTTVEDGAKWTEDGLFSFPIEKGAFDPSDGSLTLELSGSVHFQSYCYESGLCDLDSRFSDLSVTLSPSQQVVEGTYTGRPEDNPGGDYVSTQGVIATLDIYDLEPVVSDGVTTWENIPARSAPKFTLYQEGTPIDPVTIRYKGEGAKPDLTERWDDQGLPVFKAGTTASLDPGTRSSRGAPYNAQDGKGLYLSEVLRPNDDGKAGLRLLRLDPVSLKTVGTTEIWQGSDSYSRTAYDPATDTLFYQTAGTNEDGLAQLQLNAANWNASEKEFDLTPVAAIVANPEDNRTPYQSALQWNAVTNELVWITAHREAPNVFHITEIARLNSEWSANTSPLALPRGLEDVSSWVTSSIFGAQQPKSATTSAVFRDGSVGIANGASSLDEDNRTFGLPVIRLVENDGVFTAEYVDGAIAESDGRGDAYRGIYLMSDGSLATGARNSGVRTSQVLYLEASAEGTTTDLKRTFPDTDLGTASFATSDSDLGFDYFYDHVQQRIAVMKNREYLGSVDEVAASGAVFIAVGDGGLILEAEDDEGHPILQRYDLLGITPEVTAQPEAASVALTQGALEAVSTLAVDYTATGESTVQWQRRLPGEERFTNIDGATGKIGPKVALEDSGAEFRAVIENEAGKVVTDPVEVTVLSAPRFASQPSSLSVYDGDTATFNAPKTDAIDGEQRWERLEGERWVTVEDDDTYSVDGGVLRVAASDSVNGAKFRSVLWNEVGENVSDEATLTVQERQEIPEGGLALTGVSFEWSGNQELQVKSPAGAGNHFSAGVSDGSEATYLATEGNATVLQEVNGQRTQPTYESREAFIDAGGRQLVRLENGQAVLQRDGSAVVSWDASWSVNMYGGLVPFTISDPVLTVNADGSGTLVGDLAGYQSSMADPKNKTPLEPVKGVTLSTFSAAQLDRLNVNTVVPDYAGVEVEIPTGGDATQQDRESDGWGAWPQDFVDFQLLTGLSSYWYSSGSGMDANKTANPVIVDFTDAKTPPAGAAPVVTEHPLSQTVQEDSEATFSTAASGDPDPTVQWQRKLVDVAPVVGARADAAASDDGWNDIPDATGTSYTVRAATPEEVWAYRAVFTNESGTAVTDPAELTVTEKTDEGADGGGENGGADGIGGDPGSGEKKPGTGEVGATASDGGSAAKGALSTTGGASLLGLGAGALLIMCLGGAILVARRRRSGAAEE